MDYQHGNIYKILNTVDDSCYIGSTIQPLSKRMAHHRKCMNNIAKRHRLLYTKMRDLGVANFYIGLLEDYPCDNVEQLRRREGHFIREIGTLNHMIAGRTKQEHRQDNIERILEYQKEYAKQNAEYINTPITCECGHSHTRTNKSRHLKTICHQLFIESNSLII